MQAFLALAIVIYTATQLTNQDISWTDVTAGTLDNKLTGSSACLLGNPDATDAISSAYVQDFNITTNNCLMLEILGGVTIGVGILLSIVQCYTCHLCGLGGLLDGAFAFCAACCWLAASLLVNTARNDLNGVQPPYNDGFNNRRDIIYVMCWVETALLIVSFLAALFKCCCCCGGGGGKGYDI